MCSVYVKPSSSLSGILIKMIDINLFLKFLRDKKNNHFFKKIYEMGGKLSALQH